MRVISMFTVILVLMLMVIVQVSLADIPRMINYQGRLTDHITGNPMPDSSYVIAFRFYDQAEGGNVLWEEEDTVTTEQGLFNIILGKNEPLPAVLFNESTRYLDIQLQGEGPIYPRTPLLSIPYAYHALRADTSEHSLDKTIDAGELIMGSLDTARYSAYEDLVNEDRIGDQPDQVAPGDHTHPELGMRILKDTTPTTVELTDGGGEVTIKTLAIPANKLGCFMHVFVTAGRTGEGVASLSIRISDQITYMYPAIYGKKLYGFTLMGALVWKGFCIPTPSCDLYGNGYIDTSQPVVISIIGEITTGTTCSLTVYEVFVEYDTQ